MTKTSFGVRRITALHCTFRCEQTDAVSSSQDNYIIIKPVLEVLDMIAKRLAVHPPLVVLLEVDAWRSYACPFDGTTMET